MCNMKYASEIVTNISPGLPMLINEKSHNVMRVQNTTKLSLRSQKRWKRGK